MTIMLHWGVAAAVFAQWLGAHAIDHFAPGPLRVDARSVHIVVGAALSALVAFRVWWRLGRGVRLQSDRTWALAGLARLTQLALYLALISALALGMFNAWLRGDDIFGWFHLSKFGGYAAADRHALIHRVVAWHALAANAILAIAGLHAMAALVHHFILKDEVLRRMRPWALARS